MSHFAQLPQRALAQVLDEIATADLLSLARVNRRLHKVTAPFIVRSIKWPHNAQRRQAMHDFFAKHRLDVSTVGMLIYAEPNGSDDGDIAQVLDWVASCSRLRELSMRLKSGRDRAWADAMQQMDSFPSIQHLSVRFVDRADGLLGDALLWLIRRCASSLITLECQEIRSMSPSPTGPSLPALRAIVLSRDPPYTEPDETPTARLASQLLLAASSSSLSLTAGANILEHIELAATAKVTELVNTLWRWPVDMIARFGNLRKLRRWNVEQGVETDYGRLPVGLEVVSIAYSEERQIERLAEQISDRAILPSLRSLDIHCRHSQYGSFWKHREDTNQADLDRLHRSFAIIRAACAQRGVLVRCSLDGHGALQEMVPGR